MRVASEALAIGFAAMIGVGGCASYGGRAPARAAGSAGASDGAATTSSGAGAAPAGCAGALSTPQAELPATGGRAWVWFQSALPPVAGKAVKVVWKFDGTTAGNGSFGLRLDKSGGSSVGPIGGEFHMSSSWTLGSGFEWGSFFAFQSPGCWQVRAHDGQVKATIRVDVVR